MSERKTPYPDSPDGRLFCLQWDRATRYGKSEMCNRWGFDYERGKKFRSICRKYELPPNEPFAPDIGWAEQIDIIKRMNSLIAIHQKIPDEITVEIKTKLPIAFVSTADWQLGEFGVDYDNFRKDIELIRDEEGFYCGLGGDMRQNIIQPSKMGSSHNQIPIPIQYGMVVLTYKELIDKILYIGTGNHDYWTTMATGEDWDRELANRLDLVYTKHRAKINLVVGDMLYPVVRMHKGRFNSSFNLTHSNKQHQRMEFPDARIIVVEHNHVGGIEQYRYNEKECVAIRTGTYATYDDYGQQNGYSEGHICNPTVVLYPNEDRLVGFKNMWDAVPFLRHERSLQ